MPETRLIDGTELKKNIESTICYGCEMGHIVPPCGKCYVSMVLMYIDEMPEVDAQPVKYGKWVRAASGELNCSYCRYAPKWDDDKFCANCGAKMDGKALSYDRKKYEEGYKAGYEKRYEEGFHAARMYSLNLDSRQLTDRQIKEENE